MRNGASQSRSNRVRASRNVAIRLLVCLSALLGAAVEARAQIDQDASNEFWPEVQVFVRLTPKTRLQLLGAFTTARESSLGEGRYGAHLDYKFNRYLSARGGYRFGRTSSAVRETIEHRIVAEQSVRVPLGKRFALRDRNRGEMRFRNGVYSFRYRNRLWLEREVDVGSRTVTVYAMDEVFYDSRFDTWNRNRIGAGVITPLGKHASLDTYFLRQVDTRAAQRVVHAVGVKLVLSF